MTTPINWIHISMHQRLAHVVRLERGHTGKPLTARTLTYPDVYELEDFLAYALDETHSDASAMLQAVEMQGGDDFWLQLTDEEHSALPDRVSPMRVDPEAQEGVFEDSGRVHVRIGRGAQLDITQPLQQAVLDALQAQG